MHGLDIKNPCITLFNIIKMNIWILRSTTELHMKKQVDNFFVNTLWFR
jgi:hypothetical protein